MGSLRDAPRGGTRDRMEVNLPLSPRRSREDRTLPPISHLLPDIGPPHQGRPRSRGSDEHHSPSARYQIPPPPSGSRSSDHSPSYHYQPPSSSSKRASPPNNGYGDRYQAQSSHDSYRLPYHAGPPSDRGSTSVSSDGWPSKRPQSSVSSGSPYAAQHPPSQYGTPYSTSSSETPGSRRRDEEHQTSLPPPPPYHTGSNNHSPYGPPRGYADRDDRYDQYPPPAVSQAYSHDPPRPYDPRMAPPAGPSHGYYAPPPNASHPQLPPMSGHYPPSDEPARKRRGNLPRWTTDIFKAWFLEHIAHPYPSEQEKNELCVQTGCSMTQISNWFINARRRQTPVLTRQAEAERRLRDSAGASSRSNSD